MSESRVVVATIGPIMASHVMKRLGRLSSLVGPPAPMTPVEVIVDMTNPITRTMFNELPRVTDDGLHQIRAYLLSRDSTAPGSISTQAHVDSWVELVDEEIRYRKRERRGLLDTLVAALNVPNKG